eukprot:1435-Heterococcus_DN1.PRE.2
MSQDAFSERSSADAQAKLIMARPDTMHAHQSAKAHCSGSSYEYDAVPCSLCVFQYDSAAYNRAIRLLARAEQVTVQYSANYGKMGRKSHCCSTYTAVTRIAASASSATSVPRHYSSVQIAVWSYAKQSV